MQQTIFKTQTVQSSLAEYETTFVDVGIGGFFKSAYHTNYLCRLSLDSAYDIVTSQFVKVRQGDKVKAFPMLRLSDVVLSDLWKKLDNSKQGDTISEAFLTFEPHSTYMEVAEWLAITLGDKPKEAGHTDTNKLIEKYQNGLGINSVALALCIDKHLGFPIVLLNDLGSNNLIHIANQFVDNIIDISGVKSMQELSEVFHCELYRDNTACNQVDANQMNRASAETILNDLLGDTTEDLAKTKQSFMDDVWYDCRRTVFSGLLKYLSSDIGDSDGNDLDKLNQLIFIMQSNR